MSSCKKEPFDNRKVTGSVFARDNGEPIAGAKVFLRKYTAPPRPSNCLGCLDLDGDYPSRSWGEDSVVTDAHGYFQFESVDPILVYAKSKDGQYFPCDSTGATLDYTSSMLENIRLYLAPYAWVKILAYNESGAYKILTNGADDKPYELVVPPFETRELVLPAKGGRENGFYIYNRGPNNEVLSSYQFKEIYCTYRDTVVLNITF